MASNNRDSSMELSPAEMQKEMQEATHLDPHSFCADVEASGQHHCKAIDLVNLDPHPLTAAARRLRETLIANHRHSKSVNINDILADAGAVIDAKDRRRTWLTLLTGLTTVVLVLVGILGLNAYTIGLLQPLAVKNGILVANGDSNADGGGSILTVTSLSIHATSDQYLVPYNRSRTAEIRAAHSHLTTMPLRISGRAGTTGVELPPSVTLLGKLPYADAVSHYDIMCAKKSAITSVIVDADLGGIIFSLQFDKEYCRRNVKKEPERAIVGHVPAYGKPPNFSNRLPRPVAIICRGDHVSECGVYWLKAVNNSGRSDVMKILSGNSGIVLPVRDRKASRSEASNDSVAGVRPRARPADTLVLSDPTDYRKTYEECATVTDEAACAAAGCQWQYNSNDFSYLSNYDYFPPRCFPLRCEEAFLHLTVWNAELQQLNKNETVRACTAREDCKYGSYRCNTLSCLEVCKSSADCLPGYEHCLAQECSQIGYEHKCRHSEIRHTPMYGYSSGCVWRNDLNYAYCYEHETVECSHYNVDTSGNACEDDISCHWKDDSCETARCFPAGRYAVRHSGSASGQASERVQLKDLRIGDYIDAPTGPTQILALPSRDRDDLGAGSDVGYEISVDDGTGTVKKLGVSGGHLLRACFGGTGVREVREVLSENIAVGDLVQIGATVSNTTATSTAEQHSECRLVVDVQRLKQDGVWLNVYTRAEFIYIDGVAVSSRPEFGVVKSALTEFYLLLQGRALDYGIYLDFTGLEHFVDVPSLSAGGVAPGTVLYPWREALLCSVFCFIAAMIYSGSSAIALVTWYPVNFTIWRVALSLICRVGMDPGAALIASAVAVIWCMRWARFTVVSKLNL